MRLLRVAVADEMLRRPCPSGELADALGATLAGSVLVGGISVARCRTALLTLPPSARIATLGGKPVVVGANGPTFAELVIVQRLERAGFEARWMSRFGGFRSIWDWPACDPSPSLRELPAVLEGQVEPLRLKGAGVFDVAAARGDQVVFIESKSIHDRLQSTQRTWVRHVSAQGVTAEQLMLFEWIPLPAS